MSVPGGLPVSDQWAPPSALFNIRVTLTKKGKPGETVAKQPAETHVNRSDLDPRRDFVIALGKD